AAGLAPEARAAYEADALVALATGDRRLATFQGQVGGRQRNATVVYHVNLEALRRGQLEAGEVCEVPGVGPVPLATIENVVGDAVAKLVIGNGVDVTTVCHLGRTVPAHVETALEARDRSCVVPDCDVTLSLEIDHWKVPFAAGGPTALWNLARLCHFHHQLKTYEGYQLRGGPGSWEWVAPSDARDWPDGGEVESPGRGP
ncbi:MAG TPA: HNH endonuclease signature motif containing protein, partial [Acidimicrobiales bacterium]|nr:HNH endonuclease signature motif containing protein [Acidimicrobiales bacterium]